MKPAIEWLIAIVIISIVAIFIAFLSSRIAHAEEYVIIYYGQNVITIEHNGEIHAMGLGLSDVEDELKYLPSYFKNMFSIIQNEEKLTTLELAKKQENEGKWYSAGCNYFLAGDIEKANEMAYKDIDKELKKEPPAYLAASVISRMLLKDKEKALYYYIEYLDQIFEDD